MSEREDPYYPPQDPLWPDFEKFLRTEFKWRDGWNFMENRHVWWRYWLSFKAGARKYRSFQRSG